jgi:hypothetical protein
LTTAISAQKAFTYFVRIPSWVKSGMISINGEEARSFWPIDGLLAIEVKSGDTTIRLNLPLEISIGAFFPVCVWLFNADMVSEERPHGSVAVHRGPIHYAFDIPRTESILSRHSEEPRAADYEFEPAGTWQYAIDPSTLTFVHTTPSGGVLPSPIFDAGQPPNTILVKACPIEWELAGDRFPTSPPEHPTCAGPETTITLWPFGVCPLSLILYVL